mmetsp:Transcript_63554/g.138415  ORF Transcript_63554/g.138415 Transcript_63554/m.138415 type:complete len:139 (+) Transcript_63554:70-486(+)|eukprot:CAMPEP_0170619808 /NCGR_PEP_ID=MMETSP0224-20130122/27715_1 /TAXON_ID=285029 /ORGANISM="Togula jolla, Strain CCCM 725" /LENGTH=138 /DNA_ID=CAMNT_0010945925 /DNA_START=53 /DNA_END=469 /DNA_ORIENTATION=+
MLDCLLGAFLGMGIGAYNARRMRDCLDDTFHVGGHYHRKHVVPYVKNVSEKALESAGPMAKNAITKGAEFAATAGEKAGPAFRQAHTAAMPYLTSAKEKTLTGLAAAQEAAKPHLRTAGNMMSEKYEGIKSNMSKGSA